MTTLNLPNHPAHGKSASHFVKESSDCYKRREESFQRSDTDGFVSQYCSGLMGQLNRAKADIIKNGGYASFWVLMDAEGNIVSDYDFCNQYGKNTWIVKDEYIKQIGRKFVPTGDNSRVQKRLGLYEEQVEAQAWAALEGNGYGFSGNVWVEAYPIRDENKRIILK